MSRAMKTIYKLGFLIFLPSILAGVVFSILTLPADVSGLIAKGIPLNDPKTLDVIDRVILGTFLCIAGIFLRGFWMTGIVLLFIEKINFFHSRKFFLFGGYVLICFFLMHFSAKNPERLILFEEYWNQTGVRLFVCSFVVASVLFVLRPIIEKMAQFSNDALCLLKMRNFFIHGERESHGHHDRKNGCYRFQIPVFRRFMISFALSLFLAECFAYSFLTGRAFDFFLVFFVVIFPLLSFVSIEFQISGKMLHKHLGFGKKNMTTVLLGSGIGTKLQIKCIGESYHRETERAELQVIRSIVDESGSKVFGAFEIFLFGFNHLYMQMEILVNVQRFESFGKIMPLNLTLIMVDESNFKKN